MAQNDMMSNNAKFVEDVQMLKAELSNIQGISAASVFPIRTRKYEDGYKIYAKYVFDKDKEQSNLQALLDKGCTEYDVLHDHGASVTDVMSKLFEQIKSRYPDLEIQVTQNTHGMYGVDVWNEVTLTVTEAVDNISYVDDVFEALNRAHELDEGKYDDYQAQYDSLYDDAVSEDNSNRELFNQAKSDLLSKYERFVNKYRKYGVWDFKNNYPIATNYYDQHYGEGRFLRDATRMSPDDYIKGITSFEYDGSNYPFNVFNVTSHRICFFGCDGWWYDPTDYTGAMDVKNMVPDFQEYAADIEELIGHEKELQYLSGQGPDSMNYRLRDKHLRGPSKDKYNAIYDVFGKYLEKAYQDTFNILKSNGYIANKVRTNSSARVKGTPSFGFTVKNIDDEQIQSIKDILASEGIEVYDTTVYSDRKGPKMSSEDPSKYKEVLFGVWMPGLANSDKSPIKEDVLNRAHRLHEHTNLSRLSTQQKQDICAAIDNCFNTITVTNRLTHDVEQLDVRSSYKDCNNYGDRYRYRFTLLPRYVTCSFIQDLDGSQNSGLNELRNKLEEILTGLSFTVSFNSMLSGNGSYANWYPVIELWIEV